MRSPPSPCSGLTTAARLPRVLSLSPEATLRLLDAARFQGWERRTIRTGWGAGALVGGALSLIGHGLTPLHPVAPFSPLGDGYSRPFLWHGRLNTSPNDPLQIRGGFAEPTSCLAAHFELSGYCSGDLKSLRKSFRRLFRVAGLLSSDHGARPIRPSAARPEKSGRSPAASPPSAFAPLIDGTNETMPAMAARGRPQCARSPGRLARP